MSDFTGKTVLVTGGAKGIGRFISRAFIDAGAQVFACGREEPSDFRDACPGAQFHPVDVRDRQAVHDWVYTAAGKSGGVDVLVNNAGLSQWKRLSAVDEAFWDQLIDTNLRGCMWGSQAAAEAMQGRGGAIINVASLAGKRGSKNNSVYCASKFGVVGLTQALAKELGSDGIRVNSICPVYIDTQGLLEQLSGDHPEVGDQEPTRFLQDWGSRNAALGRLPTGEECAAACLWLASAEAGAITGQNINVDCGVLPQ